MKAIENPAWPKDARCKGMDTEMFYSDSPPIYYQALRECILCPVRIQCLEDALQRADIWGVRGGTLQQDRRARDVFIHQCSCGSLTNRKTKVCRACYEVSAPKKYR